jgi:hypothetical protein
MKEKNISKIAGGVARASSLTPDQRKVIAEKGAAARWGARPFHATHKGNFKEEFGIDVDCYVLNDNNKTAVISKRGMGVALGLADSGSALQRFTGGKIISATLGADLIEKINNPLIFKASTLGESSANLTVHGYDVTILIDICKAIIKARDSGSLLSSQEKIAKQAQIIVSASAKAGIQGLVYALAGYDRTKEEVIAAYKMYVMEEAREYEREFSPELYEQWYRLYGLAKPERGRPWEFKFLTIDHIYRPLARSNGKVLALARSSKHANGDKNNKIHQFLSEIGVKALRTQVGKIIGIATVSENRAEYEKYINEKIYGQQSLALENK